MKNYRLIDTKENKCVCSGDIAKVLEEFKLKNYPPEIKLVNEDGETLIDANIKYEETINKANDLLYHFCKRCPKCGRLLSKEMFHKRKASTDGLQCNCKDCHREWQKNKTKKRKNQKEDSTKDGFTNLHKVYSNPDLARFTPRELMAELKARGFKWEYMLEPQKRIMYDKI